MSKIEFPDAEPSSYTENLGIKIEPELKIALDEVKEHAKRAQKKKDVNEAIRIQLRKIVKEYWAQNHAESA